MSALLQALINSIFQGILQTYSANISLHCMKCGYKRCIRYQMPPLLPQPNTLSRVGQLLREILNYNYLIICFLPSAYMFLKDRERQVFLLIFLIPCTIHRLAQYSAYRKSLINPIEETRWNEHLNLLFLHTKETEQFQWWYQSKGSDFTEN